MKKLKTKNDRKCIKNITNWRKMPRCKSKKQREKTRANTTDTKESNNPKITSTERMRKLSQRHKVVSSSVASQLGIDCNYKAAQAMNIDKDSNRSKYLGRSDNYCTTQQFFGPNFYKTIETCLYNTEYFK